MTEWVMIEETIPVGKTVWQRCDVLTFDTYDEALYAVQGYASEHHNREGIYERQTPMPDAERPYRLTLKPGSSLTGMVPIFAVLYDHADNMIENETLAKICANATIGAMVHQVEYLGDGWNLYVSDEAAARIERTVKDHGGFLSQESGGYRIEIAWPMD